MKKYTPFFLFIIGILLVVFGIVTEENETVFVFRLEDGLYDSIENWMEQNEEDA